jgi:Na+-transporting NADH:ubiquinone oxidoreductase subunit NqrC
LTDKHPQGRGVEARPDDDTGNDQITTSGQGSPLLRWGVTAFLALVCVVALVLLVLEVVNLRPRHAEVSAADQNRSAITRAAERFVVQTNTYDAGSIDKYRSSMNSLMSPKFRTDYAQVIQQLTQTLQAAKLSSKGDVLASAVASQDPDSAQVLVVADATAKSTGGTRARHFRWVVSLVKIDGKWLVDNFSPVA